MASANPPSPIFAPGRYNSLIVFFNLGFVTLFNNLVPAKLLPATFAASVALSANFASFAASAASPTIGKTPARSSPAERKSPLARSIGIAARSASVSIPGINDA